MMQLPPDFKDFLKLLNLRQVEYLLIGGYAVSYNFSECFQERLITEIDGIDVHLIR